MIKKKRKIKIGNYIDCGREGVCEIIGDGENSWIVAWVVCPYFCDKESRHLSQISKNNLSINRIITEEELIIRKIIES